LEINVIDAQMLQKMFIAGAKNLEAKKEWINELNVFPVPDGDTGTNMTLTIMSAANEVGAIAEPTMETVAKAISTGSLRGARGNSGVILSQLFRGFTREIKKYDEINVEVLSKACVRAVETAYKAVMKPKEGTILTVAKGMADKACEMLGESDDLSYVIDEIIKHGDYVLSQTPEMLPVLKQAGVVDSGGQGLMVVIKGAYDAFLGKEVDYTLENVSTNSSMVMDEIPLDEADIKFGYCTEFIILTEKEFSDEQEKDFKGYLSSIGDSIVCVADDDVVKVHVHTNDPGLAIQRALTYGQLSRMKIDNMREEHQEKLIRDAEKIAAQEAAKENIVSAPLPALPASGDLSERNGELLDSIVMGGINGYAISSYTKYPRASLAFLNYATGFEMTVKRNEYLGIAPAREDCNKVVTVQADVAHSLFEMSEQGRISIMPTVSGADRIWTPLQTSFTDIATDPYRTDDKKYYTSDGRINHNALDALLKNTNSNIYKSIHTFNG